MKKRVLIGVVVIIILLSLTRVFAVSSNTTNSTQSNENVSNSSNTTNELSEEDLIPALEEELKEQQSKENSNSENTTSNNTVNNSSSKQNTDDEILSDVYIVSQGQSEIIYEGYNIDGNVYIISSVKVEFIDCQIQGNIFAFSETVELEGTKVDGSIYAVANNIICTESQMTTIYVATNNIQIDENSKVVNDVNIIADNVDILGEVGRNTYVQAFESSNLEYSVSIQDILPNLLAKFGIILIIAIFVLAGFPKFTEVNLHLKISSFFKAFFTGIIEIALISVIALTIMILGFGVGYAFAILMLLVAILALGKVLFVIAFAIRLVKNGKKNARTKAFIFTIFVALVVEAIELIMVLGETGFIVNLFINIILAVTGFGSLMRVIFTSKKKNNKDVPKTSEFVPVQKPVENTVIEEPKENIQTKEAPIESNLNLQIESIDSNGGKPEIYEVTGKIVKRKISFDEDETPKEDKPEEKPVEDNIDNEDKE